MAMPRSFSTKAVGVSFAPNYPENIYRLNDLAEKRTQDGLLDPISVQLRRNPENEFDPNAVEIHVLQLEEMAFIGHIPAAVAARLAPCLDSDEEWKAEIKQVAIHPSHPENPGISVQIDRVASDEPF